MISNEKEFSAFDARISDTKDTETLYSVFVTPDVTDGVKRMRAMALERHLLMRIQVMRPKSVDDTGSSDISIDRSTGIIGLEQAIGLSFKPDSEEAGLIKAILRAPEALKVIVDNYMSSKEGGRE